MRKILSYILTPIFGLVFFLWLLIFDVIQRIALKLGGYLPHKVSVDVLNLFLTRTLLLLGSHCRFRNPQKLPKDRPLIVVSNHQALFDIPPFFWFLRKHHVKFVSKIELAKGVPSISYNLNHGGNAVIDRKNPEQAIPALEKLGKYIEANNYCVVIFPEGTRSRTGKLKKFHLGGFKALMENAPSALVVPVSVNHNHKIMPKGLFPLGVGYQPTWDVHTPIDPNGRTAEEVLEEARKVIGTGVEEPKEMQMVK